MDSQCYSDLGRQSVLRVEGFALLGYLAGSMGISREGNDASLK
jgi:hypothetical protein